MTSFMASEIFNRHQRFLAGLYDRLDASHACRIEWTNSDRFHEVRGFILKHADQEWPFTDALSFCVMSELRLRRALAKDEHFRQAGCPCSLARRVLDAQRSRGKMRALTPEASQP
jgi:predicted nucleic acid-binding protein